MFRWWWFGWCWKLYYFPLTGLASFSKERGLSRRGVQCDVSTSTSRLPLYYARATTVIGQLYCIYIWLATR
jgi:hypothetical protein